MTPTRKRRLYTVLLILAGVAMAATIAAIALKDNLLFFVSPSDAGTQPPGQEFRLGGIVVENSLTRSGDGLTAEFVITDCTTTVPVRFEGILPDLFREGQGAIAIGSMDSDGGFTARQVLAKHDENYVPPELADTIEKAGPAADRCEMATDAMTEGYPG